MSRVPAVVSPDWLLAHCDEAVILDTRRLIEYRLGHVPGAVSLPFTSFVTMRGLAFYLPAPRELAAQLGERGVTRDSLVVAYDDLSGKHAARLLYSLELLGHEHLALLDRPFSVYSDDGYAVTREELVRTPATYQFTTRDDALVTKDWIRQHLTDPDVVFVDSRAPEDMAFGRIPGARSLPWYQFTSSSRVLRTPGEYREQVRTAGIARDRLVVTYCDEGTSSLLVMYALRRLGYGRVENYLASYGEWGADPALPRE